MENENPNHVTENEEEDVETDPFVPPRIQLRIPDVSDVPDDTMIITPERAAELFAWNSEMLDLTEEEAEKAEAGFRMLPYLRPPLPPEPLDDTEVRNLTLWETDAEIPAFRAGWMWVRTHWPHVPAVVEARTMELYPEDQNARVAWERGYVAARQVYSALMADAETERLAQHLKEAPPGG